MNPPPAPTSTATVPVPRPSSRNHSQSNIRGEAAAYRVSLSRARLTTPGGTSVRVTAFPIPSSSTQRMTFPEVFLSRVIASSTAARSIGPAAHATLGHIDWYPTLLWTGIGLAVGGQSMCPRVAWVTAPAAA